MESLAIILKRPLSEIEKCVKETAKIRGVSEEKVTEIILNFTSYILTVPPEILEKIMLELDIKTLGVFCGVSKQIKSMCDSQIFWKNKIVRDFGKKSLQKGEDYLLQYKRLLSMKHFVSLIITDGTLSRWKPLKLRIWEFLSAKEAEEKFGDMVTVKGTEVATNVLEDLDGNYYSLIQKKVSDVLKGEAYLILTLDFDDEEGPDWNFKFFQNVEEAKEWISYGGLGNLLPELELESEINEYSIELSKRYLRGSDEDLVKYIEEFGFPFYIDPETEDSIGAKDLANQLVQRNYVVWETDEGFVVIYATPFILGDIPDGIYPLRE